jgi:hypothetical protein
VTNLHPDTILIGLAWLGVFFDVCSILARLFLGLLLGIPIRVDPYQQPSPSWLRQRHYPTFQHI